MDKLSTIIAKCRYYKGEEDCPIGVPFTSWECEEVYVRHMAKGDNDFFKSAVDFYCNFGLDKVPELNDDNPLEVKALMFERFCHNSDSDPKSLAKSFPKYYTKNW